VTSLATIAGQTPDQINTLLKNNNIFGPGSAGIVPGDAALPLNFKYKQVVVFTNDMIIQQMCNGNHVIVQVQRLVKGAEHDHYVVATGIENCQITIDDPGNHNNQHLNVFPDNGGALIALHIYSPSGNF
jgi:hypothetical protein